MSVYPPVVSSDEVNWDEERDLVIAGAGAGGLTTALLAADRGADVLVLEKGARAGGCMGKSGAAYWVPANSMMRRDGKSDDRAAAMRYMVRLARPEAYDPTDPRLGLDEWEYAGIAAFYDTAADALDALVALGAFRPMYVPDVPDYHSLLAENAAPYGRTLYTYGPTDLPARGVHLTDDMLAKARELAIAIRYRHRIVSTVVARRAVVGLVVEHEHGTTAVRADRGVVFATGGFTHDAELRRNHLPAPILDGCAALENTGDFVRIAQALGAPLYNMNNAWMAPIPFEIARSGSPFTSGIFAVPGDSMIWVDRSGRRSANEKQVYHELAKSFFGFDSAAMLYPNLLKFMLWDQRTMDLWRLTPTDSQTPLARLAMDNWGNVVYDDFHLIKAQTLDALAAAIEQRLSELSSETGGFTLAPGFARELPKTIERFNRLAMSGRDLDFGRGEDPIERLFHGEARAGNDRPNPTMYPLSTAGPFYATIVCAGTLDTKGGPRATVDGQILGSDGEPIAGLYGVGNCVASPSGEAYWAAGGTLGPIFAAAYRLAEHLAAAPAMPGASA